MIMVDCWMCLVLAIILNPKAHFGCDDCRQSFSSLVELSLHCREKHSEVGNYMLSLNPSKLDKWNLLALNECLGVFQVEGASRLQHLLLPSMPDPGERRFQCQRCA